MDVLTYLSIFTIESMVLGQLNQAGERADGRLLTPTMLGEVRCALGLREVQI